MNVIAFIRVLLCAALCLALPVHAGIVIHDRDTVDGHPGYRSAWAASGDLDKVILIVPGFDTRNSSLPIDELQGDFAPMVQFLGFYGWDVIYFDYVDGAIDLKKNANNLARFIEHLDTQAEEGYHLAIMGGSMGGIVARTLFVQEGSDMGVDTYVSIDSPHWGVYLSQWAGDLAALAIDYPAAHQMHNGDPAHREHYGWLREVERSDWFREQVNGPMNTCAIALSDGTQPWDVAWGEQLLHNKFYPVASFVEVSGLTSTYMPYHSTAYLDSPRTRESHTWGVARYEYRNLTSSYFDKIVPNQRAEHAAPEHAVIQALIFILENGPSGG